MEAERERNANVCCSSASATYLHILYTTYQHSFPSFKNFLVHFGRNSKYMYVCLYVCNKGVRLNFVGCIFSLTNPIIDFQFLYRRYHQHQSNNNSNLRSG